MATKTPINFISPNDPNSLANALSLQKAQRNQELALLLKKKQIEQNNDLGKTQIVDGIAVRNNPLNGLASLLQTYNANEQLNNADNAIVSSQLAQQLAEYNSLAPTQSNDNLVNANNITNSSLQDLQSSIGGVAGTLAENQGKLGNLASALIGNQPAVATPVQEPTISSEPIQQQSFTPPPKGLKNPFSWQADVAPPAYTGQPITITNGNGSTSNLAGMLRPPVNDVRPLPIQETQAQVQPQVSNNDSLVNAFMGNSPQIQLPQNLQPRTNPLNPYNIDQNTLFKLKQIAPDKYADYVLKASEPTSDLRRANELGIGLDEQQRYYRMGANKDLNTAILNNGLMPQFNQQGQIIGVAPVAGFNETKAGQVQSQNKANMPFEAYKAGLEVNKQNNINTNKQNLENKNSFVEVVDDNGNTKTITKQQALNQGGFKTKENPNTLNEQKYVQVQVFKLQDKASQANANIPKMLDILELAETTPTYIGAQEKMALIKEASKFGLKLGNTNTLAKQQLLEAKIAVQNLKLFEQLKGTGNVSDKDAERIEKANGNIGIINSTLREIWRDKIGDGISSINQYNNISNTLKSNNNKYELSILNKPFVSDSKINIINGLKTRPNLLKSYFQSLTPQERAKYIQGVK